MVAGEELRDEIEELEWLVDAPEEFVVIPEGLGIRYFDDRLRVDSGDWYPAVDDIFSDYRMLIDSTDIVDTQGCILVVAVVVMLLLCVFWSSLFTK